MKIDSSIILDWIGKFLIWLGILMLLFTVYQIWGTNLAESNAQNTLQKNFDKTLENAKTKQEEARKSAKNQEMLNQLNSLPEEGEPFGIIEIESININKIFVEGITRDALRNGPGRYPNTAIPGQPGNAAIAGHRTTYGAPFENIDKIKPKDIIKVTTIQGEFYYEVQPQKDETGNELGYFIVDPTETNVLNDLDFNTLTLTACHPKYSAAKRIIVQAKLTSKPAPKSNIESKSSDQQLTESLNWQPNYLGITIMWALIVAAIAAIAAYSKKIFETKLVYIPAIPLGLAALFICFGYLEKLIPAV